MITMWWPVVNLGRGACRYSHRWILMQYELAATSRFSPQDGLRLKPVWAAITAFFAHADMKVEHIFFPTSNGAHKIKGIRECSQTNTSTSLSLTVFSKQMRRRKTQYARNPKRAGAAARAVNIPQVIRDAVQGGRGWQLGSLPSCLWLPALQSSPCVCVDGVKYSLRFIKRPPPRLRARFLEQPRIEASESETKPRERSFEVPLVSENYEPTAKPRDSETEKQFLFGGYCCVKC